MKSVINFFKNLFTSKKEQEVKIETIDHISYPGTINSCGCDDCQCGKKTYIIPLGSITPEEAEKSLQETIASYKEEIIILPDTGEIKIEPKEKKKRKPYSRKKKKEGGNEKKKSKGE